MMTRTKSMRAALLCSAALAIAAAADNLFMAGRCISGDFIAHASYRVTGSAVAMGEAVGAAAAALALHKD